MLLLPLLVTRHFLMNRRVVITGLGVVTPIGNDLDTFWHNLRNGVSGIGRIQAFDTSAFDCQIAGEIRDFEPKNYFKNSEGRPADRSLHAPRDGGGKDGDGRQRRGP